MVYKLGNVSDLDGLPPIDKKMLDILREYTSVLSNEYGEGRDVDIDDGGYVLYVTPGTPAEEIKAFFDYSAAAIEYVDKFPWTQPPTCGAMYIRHNEFAVVIVVSIDDVPAEIAEAFEEGY